MNEDEEWEKSCITEMLEHLRKRPDFIWQIMYAIGNFAEYDVPYIDKKGD